mgnify:CR=1 FL=1
MGKSNGCLDGFRLHDSFQRIGPMREGPNSAALEALAGAVAASASFTLSNRPRLSVAPLPGARKGQLVACQTSGTSGHPKTVLRSQGSWISSFEQNRLGFGLTPADRYAILGSLSSSLVAYASVEAMHLGMGLLDLCGLAPAEQTNLLRAMSATVLYCSPAQLRLLTGARRRRDAAPLPAMRHVRCGGGKLDAATRQAAAALCPGADIREFYGAAETSFITLSDDATPPGSVGRPYPGVRIEIRDAAGERTEGTGEIWVESPYLFLRYVEGDAGDTRWQDRFLTVGELGHLDAEGNLYLKGRKSRMVTVGDRNVFPEEIEAHLLTLPGIRQCAVIALPDRLRGHRLAAVIEGAGDAASADSIRRSCRSCLGPAATPRRVMFVDSLPLMAAGKPDFDALANLLAGP